MCGIAAISRALGKSSIPDARAFARHAALAIESRGRHATGFGWADRLGHPWYWKEAGAARDVAADADLPTGMRTVIVHTRHATKGSPDDYTNNHPIIADGFALVHNGRVDNDDEIFELVPDHARLGEVDSEAFVALLTNPGVLGADHPADLLPFVEGVAALAWIDADTPHTLHLARCSTRPLAIGWTRRGDFIASSTLQTLDETSRRSRVQIVDRFTVPEGSYLRVEGGKITDRRRFEVVAPPVPVPDDRPTSGKRERPLRLVDADGIDWSNLVPRRGWK